MKDSKVIVLLLVGTFAMLVSFMVMATYDIPTPPPPAPVVVVEDALVTAMKSAVMIQFSDGSSGSGTLIGRKKDGNEWCYSVLTCYHVMEDTKNELAFPGRTIEQILSICIIYQENFHAPPKTCVSSIKELKWLIPSGDWAIFTCNLPMKLPCAELATREEFESIQPFDHIYCVGGDHGLGLLSREGVIASTTAVQPLTHNDPMEMAFFRTNHGGWLGVSGSPIFTRQGKVIGICRGFPIVFRKEHLTLAIPVFTLAFKAHIVRDLLERTQSTLTVIEK